MISVRPSLIACGLAVMVSSSVACKRAQAPAVMERYDDSSYSEVEEPTVTEEAVCKHLAELLEQPELDSGEPGDRWLDVAWLDACPEELADERHWYYADDWAPYAQCMLDSVDKEQFRGCSWSTKYGPHEAGACGWFANMVASRRWEQRGQTGQVTNEELDDLEAQCLEQLARDREELPWKTYKDLVLCLEDVTYPDDVAKCYDER